MQGWMALKVLRPFLPLCSLYCIAWLGWSRGGHAGSGEEGNGFSRLFQGDGLLALSLVCPMQTLLGALQCLPAVSERGGPFSLWQWLSGAASLLLDICRGPVQAKGCPATQYENFIPSSHFFSTLHTDIAHVHRYMLLNISRDLMLCPYWSYANALLCPLGEQGSPNLLLCTVWSLSVQ